MGTYTYKVENYFQSSQKCYHGSQCTLQIYQTVDDCCAIRESLKIDCRIFNQGQEAAQNIVISKKETSRLKTNG